MNLSWKRTLRTASSERFLAQREGRDVAAVDLHCLANGTALTSERLLLVCFYLLPARHAGNGLGRGYFFER
jgi:hypothetical protein